MQPTDSNQPIKPAEQEQGNLFPETAPVKRSRGRPPGSPNKPTCKRSKAKAKSKATPALPLPQKAPVEPQELHNGRLASYYVVHVATPQRVEQKPYNAECEDIIQALNMNFNEGCLFKELWRTAAGRMGNGKPGHSESYGKNKIFHYASRIAGKQPPK